MLENETYFELADSEKKSKARIGSVGARICSLQLQGREIIRDAAKDKVLDVFSGSLLAPWPNRLRHGTFELNGKTVSFPMNEAKGNALHGLVFDKHFELKRVGEQEVYCSYKLQDENYPFELEVFVSYRLTDFGFESTMGAKNLSNEVAPFAIATHPYFLISPDTKLQLNAKSMALVDELQIPIGRASASDLRLHSGRGISELELDTDFFDFEIENERALTRLMEPDGSFVEIWQNQNLPHTMIYTTKSHPFESGPAPAVAIEPQSAPANAFNSGEELSWISPGEQVSFDWGIRVGSG